MTGAGGHGQRGHRLRRRRRDGRGSTDVRGRGGWIVYPSGVAPAPVQRHELVPRLRRESLGLYATDGRDRDPHLSEISRAIGAVSEVGFEASTVARRQAAFKVIGDQLDSLSAYHGAATAEQHGSVLPHLRLEHGAQARSPAVEEHALVAIADVEHVTHFVGGQALHVPQEHDLALGGR